MYFSKILIMAFATGALGNKAPTLPQLTAVAGAVAPAVSDAPVFRGRGADKPNSQGGDGGGIKDPVVKDGWMMEAIIAESDETNVGLGLEAKDGMEVGSLRGGRATAQREDALHQGGRTHGQPDELHGSMNQAVEKSQPSAPDFTNVKIKGTETSAVSCRENSNCRTGRCDGGRCYKKVPSGYNCNEDSDCIGRCGRNICSNGETGAACGNDDDCANRRCVHDRCRAGIHGDACERNSDCNSGRCDDDSCLDKLGNWQGCNEDSDCANDRCVHGICRPGDNGNRCERDSDCDSGRCDGTCKSKLNRGRGCNENSDCLSNNCHGIWRRQC